MPNKHIKYAHFVRPTFVPHAAYVKRYMLIKLGEKMKLEDLVEGQEFYGVLGQLVRDHDGKRKRVITTEGQVIPAGIYIECSKAIREANELGIIFKVNIGVSRKPVGVLYLHSLRKQELLTVSEWSQKYG